MFTTETESDSEDGPTLFAPLYEGVYISRSPINVDMMYISKRSIDGMDIARIRQKLLFDRDVREVVDECVEEIKNSETYFTCRSPDYFNDEALQTAMKESSVQFSILRNPDLTHTPGFSVFEQGYILKTMHLFKEANGSWKVFGAVSQSRAFKLNVQRHPLGTKMYYFVPICDGKCNWGSQKLKEDALETFRTLSNSGMKPWMHSLIAGFAYGKRCFDHFIIEEYEKQKKERRRKKRDEGPKAD